MENRTTADQQETSSSSSNVNCTLVDGQVAPIDLVKKVKSEPMECGNEENVALPDICGVGPVQRQRLGGGYHGRFSPYMRMINSGQRNDGLNPSLQIKTNRVHFICQQCKTVFNNRDALAMHMMDSVRNEAGGVPGTSLNCCNLSPSSAAPSASSITTRLTRPASQQQMSSATRTESVSSTVSDAARLLLQTSSARASGGYVCRICTDPHSSLDSLAMHMLAHAHQEQLCQQLVGATKLRAASTTNEQNAAAVAAAATYAEYLHSLSSSVQQTQKFAAAAAAAAAVQVNTAVAAAAGSLSEERQHKASSPARPKCHSEPLECAAMSENDRQPESAPATVRHSSSQNTMMESSEDDNQTRQEFSNTNGITEGFQQSNVDEHCSEVEDLGDDNCVTLVAEPVSSPPALSANSSCPHLCPHCVIRFADRTMFCLHMGLHSVTNPWKCNMCGQVLRNRHEFASHALHF